MDAEGVSLPLFHKHLMMPCNDLKECDCCQRFETDSDGYYCQSCDVFLHKSCVEAPEFIQHPSHSPHFLRRLGEGGHCCDLCGSRIAHLLYRCDICDFDIDLYCAKYPPPEIIDISETHHHKLTRTRIKEYSSFKCDTKCGKPSVNGVCYKCHECDSIFHVGCVIEPPPQSRLDLLALGFKPPLEVNHLYHSLHPLKLLEGQPPNYSDGICRLCEREIDDKCFYHCSYCNFSLDIRCVFHPPPQFLLDLKTHDHQLTLLPRLDSFTCSACGLKADRSPYICVQCCFFIHQDCVGLPRIININRHDHRISRVSLIGVVNSVCGVCHKKVDWTWGGYSCHRCLDYVVHSKCATTKDVWNGEELEDIPEEIEDIEPYVVIDANTIQHFSHKEHYLRHNDSSLIWEDNKWCNACTSPIDFHSFYGCMDCDFFLHEKCAQLPKKKRHVLHNDQLTLVTNDINGFLCGACCRPSNGFRYQHGRIKLDARCSSIFEPFFHPSHPHHPLYYSTESFEFCNGCNSFGDRMLRCIEDGCEFFLDFNCATLPQAAKHRVDDHPLSLCYGEEASGVNWCDICEKETNPKTWFYTCKDHQACLHTKCVLGSSKFLPKSTMKVLELLCEVVLNSSVSRPFCSECKSRCVHPIILKGIGTSNICVCSLLCLYSVREVS